MHHLLFLMLVQCTAGMLTRAILLHIRHCPVCLLCLDISLHVQTSTHSLYSRQAYQRVCMMKCGFTEKLVALMLQGGNARELTVNKMREEIESHALYELNATLTRSTGSRRLPKLKPLLSNPSGFALSRQQTSPQAALQLLQSLSNRADVPAVQHDNVTPAKVLPKLAAAVNKCGNAASQLPRKISYGPDTSSSTEAARLAWQMTQYGSGNQELCDSSVTSVLSREAMLLLGPDKYPLAAQPCQQSARNIGKVPAQTAEGKAVAQILEAITYEERYHRAGRDVLGQHVDAKALALARADHLKRHRKYQVQQLGYQPLRLQPETSLKRALAVNASLQVYNLREDLQQRCPTALCDV